MNSEKSLIIIDDEKSLLFVLQDYLEECGLKVFTYESIPDLESELKQKNPHAVLLDILMPRVSGIEILKKIKNIDPRMPVIMMTGFADDARRLEALRNGAYSLLTKPFTNLEELYHTINNAMNHHLEIIRTQELSVEVEERYRRERMNLLELDFLKSLQHMIGETEEPATVFKNVSTLLQNFLGFDNFATLVPEGDTARIEIFPDPGSDAVAGPIVHCLMNSIPQSARDGIVRLVVQEKEHELNSAPAQDPGCAICELATAKKVYGYAGIFRALPVEPQAELIFNRFCSHIAPILEKISLFNEIKMLSIHDGLTGAFNHVYALDVMDLEVARAERYGVTFSTVLVDVDNFKDVNDTYGHLAGDFILRGIAKIFGETLREIDVVGRYGGEEFIVILPQTDSEAAVNAAERLRSAVEAERFVHDGKAIHITISIGVATYREGGDTQLMIKMADDCLYRAKKEGRNRTCYVQ